MHTARNKMHALNLCFISTACFSAFIAVPTNTKNSKIFITLFIYFISVPDIWTLTCIVVVACILFWLWVVMYCSRWPNNVKRIVWTRVADNRTVGLQWSPSYSDSSSRFDAVTRILLHDRYATILTIRGSWCRNVSSRNKIWLLLVLHWKITQLWKGICN